MRKLKLNLQHLDNVEVLSREQLKKVLGGDVGSGSGGQIHQWNTKCQCNGTGTWYANYTNAQQAASDLARYCTNGGSCTTGSYTTGS